MKSDLLAEIRAKAQAGVGRRMFGQADESERLLHKLGADIATSCGCSVAFGRQKDSGRALQKVTAEKGGDWYALYDVVRMTILAPDEARLRRVQSAVRARCTPQNRLGLIRDIELRPDQSACGYSGLLFVVRLQNERPGEIQANLPNVLYGQFPEPTFRELVGDAGFTRVQGRYQIEGGIGHQLYEVYRAAPGSPQGSQAAALSRRYFDYLRGIPDPSNGRAIRRDVDRFRRAHRHHFLG